MGNRSQSLRWSLRSTGRIAAALLTVPMACGEPPPPQTRAAPSSTTRDPTPFNDNGGWSWFQDPRAIVDPAGQTLLVSSVGSHPGPGGDLRNGGIDMTVFDLTTSTSGRVTLSNLPTHAHGDDHNAAALWQRPDGRYLAVYTGHLWQADGAPQSFYRISAHPHDGTLWKAEQTFTWPANDVTPPIHNDATYSNLFYLASEDRLYNIARAADRTPNIMISDDWGSTWSYGGKLSRTAADDQDGQFSNGYFRFASNGVDRIDFIATEHHPRDFSTSIYHGYVHGGQSFDSHGTLVDDDIFDEVAPAPADFTPLWTTAEATKSSHHHGWTVDLERDDDGNPHALFTTRYGTSMVSHTLGDADHRLFYARFDGIAWQSTEIAKMGKPLYHVEEDYTGLGAIHPDQPSRIYISTPIDPRAGSKTAHHEIYEGVTLDDGASWRWAPITWNSTEDNLRPIVPSWDADHTAVLWLRGRYFSQQHYDLAVVGLISG